MKGFSLIELMVGLTIAAFLLLGLIQYGQHTSSQYLAWRRHQEAHSNLLNAQAALGRVASLEERDFWKAFPLTAELVHPVGHAHHGKQFTNACPDAPTGGCIVFFDIQPTATPMERYEVVDHDWPAWLHPTPMDETLPMGPGEEIQPQTVVWVQTATGGFPFVVSEVAGDRVYPVKEALHPWKIPAFEINPEETRVLILGKLSVLHIHLNSLPERHHALRYQPWRWDDGEWRAQRSRTGDTHLVDLVITNCNETLPDRVTLLAQPRQAQPLPHPIRIGGTNYQTEVFHATLAY